MKIGIVGAGHIGSEIYKQAKSFGWDIKFVLRRSGIYRDLTQKVASLESLPEYSKGLDVVFLAIPTLDDGKIALDYIQFFLGRNAGVVTCEKGALSNYFSELEKSLSRVGYSATVGGGTRMLRFLEERTSQRVTELHAVVNGTLNYILDEVSSGRSLGEVAEETRKLGYAEPGTENPLDVINKEAGEDVPMKSSILFNVCRFGDERIRARDMKVYRMGENELRKLLRESYNRRYIVSVTKDNGEEDVIGGFRHKAGEWVISAGFKNINENPLFLQLVPRGVNNAVIVCEGKYGIAGTYRLSGQGAGAGPTTASMIRDAMLVSQALKI